MSPSDLIRTSGLVKHSVLVRENVQAFVDGFREPARAQLTTKIPLDEWETYITNVKAIFTPKEASGKS